ncbi:MAG: hypothetical protein GY754_41205 [bacterium]|nr:hypothetical protein [bacterium]
MKKANSKKEKLKKILTGLTREELENLVDEQAMTDNQYYNKIIQKYNTPDQKPDKEYYNDFIQSYLEAAQNRDGFIDYYTAWEAAEGAYKVLKEAEEAINNLEYEKAILMAEAIIEEMVPSLQYTDDSGGEAGEVIESAFKLLHDCAKHELNEDLRKNYYNYSLKESTNKRYKGWSDWQVSFIQIAFTIAQGNEEYKKLLRQIESFIAQEEKQEYKSGYILEEMGSIKIEILHKNGKHEEAEQYFNSNLTIPGFRKKALEAAYAQKDYKRIIELALEGEKIDTEERNWGLISDWQEWRFKAYKGQKETENMKKLAKEFILENRDIKYFTIYKKTFSDKEWKKEYKQLKIELLKKAGTGFPDALAEILSKEKETKELLDIVSQHPSSVDVYRKDLIKLYPREVYKLYCINIKNAAKRADNRKRYKYVCNDIKNLMKLGGKDEASGLIKELKDEYKNRPAFQNELSKISV